MSNAFHFPIRSAHRLKLGRRRTGAVTLEAILVIPALLIITVAALEFGIVMVVEQSITQAATSGAHEAAKEVALNTPSGTADELVGVVNTILEPHDLTVGSSVSLALEVGGFPTENRGTLACDPPVFPPVGSDEVRVTVCVRLDTKPFPNLLSSFGIDLSDRCVSRSTLVKQE